MIFDKDFLKLTYVNDTFLRFFANLINEEEVFISMRRGSSARISSSLMDGYSDISGDLDIDYDKIYSKLVNLEVKKIAYDSQLKDK